MLVASNLGTASFELDVHVKITLLARAHHQKVMADIFTEKFDALLSFLSRECAILQGKDCNLSSWLALLPVEGDQFDLATH